MSSYKKQLSKFVVYNLLIDAYLFSGGIQYNELYSYVDNMKYKFIFYIKDKNISIYKYDINSVYIIECDLTNKVSFISVDKLSIFKYPYIDFENMIYSFWRCFENMNSER